MGSAVLKESQDNKALAWDAVHQEDFRCCILITLHAEAKTLENCATTRRREE